MKILVTAFEPFNGEAMNPALEVVKRLPDQILGHELVWRVLPTAFGGARAELESVLGELEPDLVLCLGQAGGRKGLTLERVAINVMDAPIPDNAGEQPIDDPVRAEGPAAYFSTLPLKALLAGMQERGQEIRLSNTAGTFVCNQVLYEVLHWASQHRPALRAGFLHLPYLPEQVENKPGVASLSLEQMLEGVLVLLELLVEHEGQDMKVAAGTTH
ncbi:pyroglutamyl-peptidase I [Streptococcus danieliae]|uniref:Pyrrolidone-carboxylate peptidase n=1 Tax=Streptococcus danieliae TaxID=747656 RepID=A0A7Z0S461_9STRE|nr:pyroglutamyl-peptidase I [Streptococcus danieliae]MBF0698839.1 pyroglutamyl-peptidase I [Streptococcus danieliae]MVX59229.1 pyroglutamyl-peptidase I [Streptococcus danieliae]NYS96016.1 pyroglutamyl-peptidase I [Streptococcus danieliae]